MNVSPETAKSLPMPRYITEVKPEQIKFWTDLMTEQKILKEPLDPVAALAQ